MSSKIAAVPFYQHSLHPEQDAARVAAVLATPFLTSGTVGQQVEAQLCEYFGVKHAALTNSWTNGAIATLLALGVGPGDEVIVPAMTFVATANAAEMLGARPVFVDVDPGTLLMSADAVRGAIGPATKAIIPVHLYGQMVDVEAISVACRSQTHKIWILEDAAHCFEGTRDGLRPCRYSDAALFSFYATKNVTCAEGGAVITNNPELLAKLTATRNHGMSKGALDRFQDGKYQEWDMEVLGMKANLPDVLAALLPGQIASIDAMLPTRQAVAARYRAAFTDGPLRLVALDDHCVSAEHLFPIGVPSEVRDEAIGVLNAHGIGCTVNYRAVPFTRYYRSKYRHSPNEYPVSHDWGTQTLTLPLYPSLANELQDRVIEVVTTDIYSLLN
jgi:dTDP-4-amino-4,6-dideoxygalactose transaminase